ncbi:hypothetical protein HO133_007542 [Letharia lupina]|uniref:Uncharacterized protein n=1 Tax=Letharia lupina TaxID=560253 RepID=A0A8H6KYZ1_9LECA|nr:uncharacterized protein HO133_007542 [Letharia lupina]KAF6229426.1 hypothetical protein HO133_007542 [Letharia lupina]
MEEMPTRRITRTIPFPTGPPPPDQAAQEQTMISAQFVAGDQLANTADDPKRTFAERYSTSPPDLGEQERAMVSAQLAAGDGSSHRSAPSAGAADHNFANTAHNEL